MHGIGAVSSWCVVYTRLRNNDAVVDYYSTAVIVGFLKLVATYLVS